MRKLSQQTHLASVTDQLTGLYNLQYFGIRLEEELNRAWRFNHSLSLLLVDFDDFSAVNERYGRFVGDEVLRRFARCCLLGILRTTDMAARYGGDEFAVLLTGTDAQGAVRITQRIQELVQQGIPLSTGKFLNIGVSIGVATFPNDGATRKGLLQLAEARLNEAKRGKGRGRPSSRSFPWPRDIFQSERVSM